MDLEAPPMAALPSFSLAEVVAPAVLLLLLRSRWGVLLKGLLLGLGSASVVLFV